MAISRADIMASRQQTMISAFLRPSKRVVTVMFAEEIRGITPGTFLRKTALLVGEIVERYNPKPLWNKIVKKRVKQILKRSIELAKLEDLVYVSG